MNCVNCGNALAAGARFCPNCGRPAADAGPQPPPGPSPYGSPPPYGSQGGGGQQQQWQTSWGVGSQAAAPPRRKSRLGKILLIVFGVLLVIGAATGVGVYYMYRFVERTLKESEAYRVAVEQLKKSPEATEYLGEVRETGFPMGNIRESSGGTGSAAFTMSVEGSKASGQYVVTMSRTGGRWSVTDGYLRTSGGQIIHLTEEPAASAEVAPPAANTNTSTRRPVGRPAVSGGVLDGKAIEKPAPAYPPVARAARASGTVTVQVTVDEQGRVVEAKAVGGHPLLRASAEAAARQARFSPTLLSGKPVRVTGVLTYNFSPE